MLEIIEMIFSVLFIGITMLFGFGAFWVANEEKNNTAEKIINELNNTFSELKKN